MAKIISVKDNRKIEVPDGERIQEACENLGVPFCCTNGICGTCMIDVVKGKNNLSELTEEEHDLGRDKEHRLACQCKIKTGEIEIEF